MWVNRLIQNPSSCEKVRASSVHVGFQSLSCLACSTLSLLGFGSVNKRPSSCVLQMVVEHAVDLPNAHLLAQSIKLNDHVRSHIPTQRNRFCSTTCAHESSGQVTSVNIPCKDDKSEQVLMKVPLSLTSAKGGYLTYFPSCCKSTVLG